ncbi:MAG: ATP-grasp domain-containing protein [bacterium]|nr:ATP-grasp domain-containing protein [bacterium]
MFSKTRVAVLRGGPSSEYHVSLKTGANVLSRLPEKYHALDVLIDRDGMWHLKGKVEPSEKILGKVDVVWNALHGEYGEDGGVQHLLEAHAIPFTGSGRLASALSYSKILAKKIAENAGIKTPQYRILRSEEISSLPALAEELYRTFPHPSIVKPASSGSSIGVSVATTPEELFSALSTAFSLSDVILIEEYIEGKEASTGIIEGFRGQKFYPLIPVEVVLPQDGRFLDFDTRYAEDREHRCPGGFSNREKEELQALATTIHKLLGLRHYSRSEFIVHPKRGIFFLEADSVPDLHEGVSPYLHSLGAVGATTRDFLGHVLSLALERN